jgi:medium-chain acyl-[acyl-carrier-protein] hydrolase
MNSNTKLRIQRLNPWLCIPRPEPAAKKRLFIFHHAGASSAAYYSWVPKFPASVEVVLADLPGRGTRFREALLTDTEEAVAGFRRALEDCMDKPFSFFGHSLGGVIAYLLTIEQERYGKCLPEQLFISSAQPCWSEQRAEGSDRVALINYLRNMGGTPQIVFDTEEFLNLTLRVVQHDLKLLERPAPEMRPVNCPIYAFVGDSDSSVSVENAEYWRYWTTRLFELRVFAGGHFFLNQYQDELIRDISRKMF